MSQAWRSCHCEPFFSPSLRARDGEATQSSSHGGQSIKKNIQVEYMHSRQPTVYIMASKRNGTLYVGVTSDLIRRVYQHKQEETPGFTKQYQCKHLVYYEQHEDMYSAIVREKQIKGGSREKKLALIESMNPFWQDLYETLL